VHKLEIGSLSLEASSRGLPGGAGAEVEPLPRPSCSVLATCGICSFLLLQCWELNQGLVCALPLSSISSPLVYVLFLRQHLSLTV
jgi:hypothetical protein